MKFAAVPTDSDDDWRARLQIWRDGRAVVGGSDAGAHVDRHSTFNTTTRMLQQAVRERQLLSLEEAIHLVTDVPSRLYGLTGRGRLTEGGVADMVIFDEDTIGSNQPYPRYDLPGGGERLYADAVGIDHVFVNGVEVVEGQSFTGARPGTILRSGRDSTTPQID